MTYGLVVKNNSNQVIVDSDLFHYHFQGKLSPNSSTQVPDILSGPGSQPYGPNENKGMQNLPAAGTIYKYTAPVNGPLPPMCFIKSPDGASATGAFLGIILTKKEGSTWSIWVFSDKPLSSNPILYTFSPKDQITNTTSDTVGLQTKNSAGATTFDSRFKPLRVVGGGSLTAPSLAHTGSSGSNLDVNLGVNATSISSTFTAQSGNANDLIYYIPSIAHSCQQYEWQGADSGISDWQNFAWARTDLWWCFYRAGFRINSNSTIQCNYGVYARGHVYDHVSDSSSIIASILLGAITGGVYFAAALAVIVASGAFTNSGVAAGGYLPYVNGSRNNNLSNSYIITKASYYD